MHLVHLAGACHAEQVDLIGRGWLLALLYVHVPVEEVGEAGVGQEALGEVEHALRAHVGQAVSLLVVVQKSPGRVTFSIGLLNIHPVSVHIDGKHGLLIKVDHLE